MTHIERCDFIALIVRDIPRSVRFYQETLGLHLRFVEGNSYALFQVGTTKLALQAARPAGPDLPVAVDLVAPTPGAGASALIAFAVPDVDRWCGTLTERGVAIAREPADYPWGDREFSIDDPDGHILIFYSRPPQRAAQAVAA